MPEVPNDAQYSKECVVCTVHVNFETIHQVRTTAKSGAQSHNLLFEHVEKSREVHEL